MEFGTGKCAVVNKKWLKRNNRRNTTYQIKKETELLEHSKIMSISEY